MGNESDSSPDCLWKYSREPLTVPLLARLCRTDLEEEDRIRAWQVAEIVSRAILTYMGDDRLVRRKARPRELKSLTDTIFSPMLRHEGLRDEVYCQLIKQITCNPCRLVLEDTCAYS
ncbi:unnamed protein product [Protopolystoma xenopodis]|uniref:MyTH4 domain-containing protein n=1 Tax=Protopolystoma xenopodis TaxID=117903 RepID=A0A448WKP6_9PLAT|nr:unnamed protein product [Protopolystoma xenopodis]